MAEYADESEMPSIWTKRTGKSITLPDVSWSDLEAGTQGRDFDLNGLASVLRFSFGQIGSFRVPGGERVRKANPSGGAKHPTEGWLEMGHSWCGIQPGTYFYDPENHALVQTETQTPASAGAGLTLSVRSRLERAMWRYRDPRSSRAVLFDAGHVIENLFILLRFLGTDAYLHPGRLLCGFGADDFREPELGRIDIPIDNSPLGLSPVYHGSAANTTEQDIGEPFVLNPFAYFTLKNGGLTGNIAYPKHRRVDLSPVEFSILTHCIPSSRGAPSRSRDRYTTTKDIVEAIPCSSEADIERLESNGLLLRQTHASVLWPQVRRWAEKGWYLPLLAWTEASTPAGHAVPTEREASNGRSISGLTDIAKPLRKRITSRSFTDQQITSSRLRSIIQHSLVADSSVSTATLFIAPFKISGLPAETLHYWDNVNNQFVTTENRATVDDIVRVTIGQGWVRNCAAMIWLMSTIDTGCPRHYVSPHVLLGRIAQRVALLSTTHELGVFQTPATLDADLAALLGCEPSPDTLSYSVAIGATSRKAAV
ncbi:hypothetical protein GCM10027521_05280 [Amycolatopsis cihanbeyliensis]